MTDLFEIWDQLPEFTRQHQIKQRRLARRKLLDRVNQAIQYANIKRAKHPGSWFLLKPLNRNQINKAVCIARRPGPLLDFKAGQLDELLINAGFRP